MSLITCCPACGTMFKVVADQLRISEGWVRCGHCSEVFDASAHMQDAAHAIEAPVQLPPPEVHDLAAPPAGLTHATPADVPPSRSLPAGNPSATSETAFDVPPSARHEGGSLAPTIDSPSSAPAANALVTSWNAEDGPAYSAFELRRADLGDNASARPVTDPADDASRMADADSHSPASEWAGAQQDADASEAGEQDPHEATHDVSFVRDARRKALWRRPGVRVALVVVALLLGALLAAQVVLHERDRVATLYPPMRPVLLRMCEPLGCSIGPLRRIDAVVIDSSALNKLRPDLYRVNLTLKNQAHAPVAFPSLELTLTDTQDQPVLRRVIAPDQLGTGAPVIGGSSEWVGSVLLAVDPNAGAARIAGYRLLAFYP